MSKKSGRSRCCRCHLTLTSEDRHFYGANCEPCEVDYRYEEAERHNPVKSAYWRWRAMCFGLRWLWGVTEIGSAMFRRAMHRSLRRVRSVLRNDRPARGDAGGWR